MYSVRVLLKEDGGWPAGRLAPFPVPRADGEPAGYRITLPTGRSVVVDLHAEFAVDDATITSSHPIEYAVDGATLQRAFTVARGPAVSWFEIDEQIDTTAADGGVITGCRRTEPPAGIYQLDKDQ